MSSAESPLRAGHPTPVPRIDPDAVNHYGDTHRTAPYSEALHTLAAEDWQRLHVPGHHGEAANAPELAAIFGEQVLKMDFPMLFSQVDQESWELRSGGSTPQNRALALAADAWGASQAWFLTNGASMGNHIASLAARALSSRVIVQRSMHASAIDGMILAGLEPTFIEPTVDAELGTAHGVTPAQVAEALAAAPDAGSVYLVSPSYFGAIADIAGIAEVAHAHGVPLIVDEAWGSHLGFHPEVPTNASRLGADLVVSSTHKFAGSLTQSAMILLGHGEQAERLRPIVDRVQRSVQSTSSSALLTLSLDEARRRLAVHGEADLSRTLAEVAKIRAGITAGGRFTDATERIAASPDVFATDPLKIVIDTRAAGISGNEAHHRLIRDHRIYVEMATHSALVLLIGANAHLDVDRFLAALHALPEVPESMQRVPSLPARGAAALNARDAYFADHEAVSAEDAVGRISADSLAAYPPGIPNVLPGERLNAETISFLRATGASASGHVRGAYVSDLSLFRVVAEPALTEAAAPAAPGAR